MTQKFWVILYWFSTPQLARLRPISGGGQWENHMCRIHAGSSKARSAQVLRNSPRAMQLSGYELVPELTCDESALLCFL